MICVVIGIFFFFFKQKTSYEMRISDWSSDVCSSDLGFAGAQFHTARWDASVDLAGKRVGVIGTGASAIQVVPGIVDRVEHLTVFQRSPPWIVPRSEEHTSELQSLMRISYAVFCLKKKKK